MKPLILGEPAPWFGARTPTRDNFPFSNVAGRYVLLGFLPADPAHRAAALAGLDPIRELFDGERLASYLVIEDEAAFGSVQDEIGRGWFLDPSGGIAQLYDAADPSGARFPRWVLIDPSLRVLQISPIDAVAAVVARIRGLPPVEEHAGAGVGLHAPVLLVPRVFEPEICRHLIAHYEADGGAPSGVMREIDGRTVGVLDSYKSRRDAPINDDGLQKVLNARIARRLVPEIQKAFQFTATRIERYIVACYDAEDGGYFRPHRDNTTAGTAHRRFAVSINLNAEEFEGGDLRFPEFPGRTYRPPTGGAVVFSCSLLHEATPVTRGRRYAFLPFLYDDAADLVRQRNRHLLDLDEDPPADQASAAE